jgi:hypothetical protein
MLNQPTIDKLTSVSYFWSNRTAIEAVSVGEVG